MICTLAAVFFSSRPKANASLLQKHVRHGPTCILVLLFIYESTSALAQINGTG